MKAIVRAGASTAALLLLLPSGDAAPAGYGGDITDRVTVQALRDKAVGEETLRVRRTALADSREQTVFRRWLYDAVADLPDHRLRAEFYARYPRPADFEAGFRTFLMADPSRPLLGVDRYVPEPVERRRGGRIVVAAPEGDPTFLNLLRRGASYPFLDVRNRDRLFLAPDGSAVEDPRGEPLPFDPATLNTGARTGPTSDAHARLALPPGPKSGDLRVLEQRPWDFAVPFAFGDSVRTFTAANVSLYTDLSILAALAPDGQNESLSLLFGGMALHYLAQASNPLNTLQVGSAAIHQPTTRERWRRRLRTLFGLLGRDDPMGQEALERAEVYRFAGSALLRTAADDAVESVPGPVRRGVAEGDEDFRAHLVQRLRRAAPGEWPAELVAGLAAASHREGAEAFDLLAVIGDRALRDATPEELDELSDERLVERFFADRHRGRNTRSMARLWEIHGAALGRMHAVYDLWWDRLREDVDDANEPVLESVLNRMVSRQLTYLAEADARRARYTVERRVEGGL